MDTAIASGFLEEVNQRTDPVRLLEHIGYAADKIQVVGDSVKCFCPIHRDSRFRSLLIDRKKATFKCTIKTCAGFAGGSLVDLAALARNADSLTAAVEIAGALDLDIPGDWYARIAGALVADARAAGEAGDRAAELDALGRALRVQPAMAEAHLRVARIAVADGDSVQALESFSAAVEALLADRNFAGADSALREAVDFMPESEDILFLRVRAAEEQGDAAGHARLLQELASAREKTGRLGDNVGVYQKLVELRPDDTDLKVKLASAHEQKHDIRNAVRALEDAIASLRAGGRGGETIPLLEKIIQFEPSQRRLRIEIADELLREGEYVRAKDHIFKTVNILLEQGDFVAAGETARKWLEVEPDSVETHEALARVKTEMGDSDGAAGELRLCSGILIRQGNTTQGLEYLFRVKFTQPDDAGIRREIVRLLSDLHQPERAAMELLDLAEVLFAGGSADEAAAALREAGGLNPTPDFRMLVAAALRGHGLGDEAAEAALSAADAAEKGGDVPTALDCLAQYLESRPDDLAVATRCCRMKWGVVDPAQALAETTALAGRLLDAGNRVASAEMLDLAAIHAAAADSAASRALLALGVRAGRAETALAFYGGAVRDLLDGGNDATALDIARQALELAPEAEFILRDAARCCDALGLGEEAAEMHARIADLLERAGDTQAACGALQAASAADPKRTDLLRRRARLLQQLGRADEARESAIQALRRATESGPDDEALAAFPLFLDDFPADEEIRLEYAEKLAACGRTPEAVEQFSQLLRRAEKRGDPVGSLALRERMAVLDPDNPRVRLDLAASYREQGDAARADAVYRETAAACTVAGRHAEAAEAWRALCAMDPGDADALENLARAEKSAGNEAGFEECLDRLFLAGRTGLAVEWFCDRSRAALKANRVKEARDYTQRWLRFAPEDPDALEQMAALHARQNRTQRAVETWLAAAGACKSDPARAAANLRKALESEPENVVARQALWQALLDTGDEDKAVEEMQQLADLLIERRAYREASTVLSRILEYRTQSADTLRRLASLIHEHEGFAKALPHFRKLLSVRGEIDPPAEVAKEYEAILRLEGAGIELRAEYADFLEESGDRRGAKEQLLQVAQACRDEFNDPVRAIQFFGRATSLEPGPGDARIFEEVANLHLTVEVPEFAAESLREAVRLYEQQGENERAQEALTRLAGMENATVDDLVHLGDIEMRMNRREPAVGAYRRALDMARDAAGAGPQQLRRAAEKLLEVEPHDAECAIVLISGLPPQQAADRAMELQARFSLSGMGAERVRVLQQGAASAPERMDVRRELVSALRETGPPEVLAEALETLGEMELAAGNRDGAREAARELAELPAGAETLEKAAELAGRCGDSERAAQCFCRATEIFAGAGRMADAARTLAAAEHSDMASVPSSLVASLYRKAGGAEELRPLVLEAFDSALRARSRTPALLVGTAFLEFTPHAEVEAVLRRISERAGTAFVVAVGGAHSDWLYDHGQQDQAARVVAQITSIAGNLPDAWWLASQFHRKQGDRQASADASLKAARLFAEAGAVTEEESCYRDALEEFPDDAGVLETLAFFYSRERRIPEAIETMRRLASLAAAEGNLDGAVRWLDHILEHLPTDGEARERLVEHLTTLGRDEESVPHLLELGSVRHAAGDSAGAILMLERALEFDFSNAPVITRLLDIAGETGDTERMDRYSHMLADTKAQEGELKLACVILNSLLEKDPENLKALEKLAIYTRRASDERGCARALGTLAHKLARRGEYARAVTPLEELLALKPGDRDTLQLLTDCCSAAGQNDKALGFALVLLDQARAAGEIGRLRQAAEGVLAIDDTRADAHAELAEALLALKEPAEAAGEWGRAAELHQAAHRYAEAAAALGRVVENGQADEDTLVRRAELLTAAGDGEAARNAWLDLAALHAAAGEFDRVEPIVNRVLEREYNDPAVHLKVLETYRAGGTAEDILTELAWLAAHYLRVHNLPAATAVIEEGLEIDPQDVGLQDSRLELLRRMDRGEELQFRLRELAERLLANDDVRRAALLFEELSRLDPDLPDVRRESAALWKRLGDEQRARDELFGVVAALLKRSETESAREAADELIATAPADAALRARLAEIFLASNQPDLSARLFAAAAGIAASEGGEADRISYLERACEAGPRSTDNLRQLAEACVEAHRPDEAAEAFRHLVELHMDQKRYHEAVSVLRRQITLYPKEIPPRRQLVELYEKTGNKEGRVTELHDLADLMLSLGRIDDAVDIYRQMVSLRPDDVPLLQKYIELFEQVGNEQEILGDYLQLADAYARKGQFVEATRTFEKVLTINRRDTAAREQFIAFLKNCGQKTRAIAEMVKLADIQRAAKHSRDAQKTLAGALALNPDDPEVCLALALSSDEAGDRSGAVAHFDKASLLLAPENPAKAADAMRQALRLDPDRLDIRERLAAQLESSGDLAGAAAAQRELAGAYERLGRPESASASRQKASTMAPRLLAMLRERLAAPPADPERRYADCVALGDLLAERGDVDEALKSYQQARAIRDDSPDLIQKVIDNLVMIVPEHEAIADFLALAACHARFGDPKKAQDIYAHVLLLDPHNATAKAALGMGPKPRGGKKH